jgi:excisionase family DNA binding protein
MDRSVLAVSIREAARCLSLSPRTLATLVASHELPSRKVGHRRIIPIDALEAFLRRGMSASDGHLGRSGDHTGEARSGESSD